MIIVGQRHGGRTTIRIRSRWGIWSHAIHVSHGCRQLVAFLSLEEQLSYLLAPPLVFSGGNRFILFLVLVFVVDGTETVLGILSLVLRFRVFCLDFPDTLLLQGKRSPAVA